MVGKVYLVGAGPGDPDLITVKGLRCLKQADVILYDRLVNPELLENAKEGAQLVYCGKLPHYHTMKQETINHFLVKYAKKGYNVVRLKGGDPFVFGRGGEEAEECAKHNVPFEIVPGITAGIAASAYAGIPVTHRTLSKSFAFITGHQAGDACAEHHWAHPLKSPINNIVVNTYSIDFFNIFFSPGYISILLSSFSNTPFYFYIAFKS